MQCKCGKEMSYIDNYPVNLDNTIVYYCEHCGRLCIEYVEYAGYEPMKQEPVYEWFEHKYANNTK